MQKERPVFIPVKKVLNIINSCETGKQLSSCKKLIDNYVKLIKMQGVVNPELVRKRLMKEFNQKKFQINMIKLFVAKHQKEFYKVHEQAIA
jgi:hypothetical protein